MSGFHRIWGSIERVSALGLDGCRADWRSLGVELPAGGWIAVGLDGDLAFVAVVAEASTLISTMPREAVVAIDMPIGLPARGTRPVDPAARRLLPSGRKSSVFPCPPRPLLAARSYPEALTLGRALDGRGLSKQAWNILPKIRELDRLLRPADQARVIESHPEVAFHARAGGLVLPPKRKPEGGAARLEILAEAGIVGLEAVLEALPRRLAAPDDLLDAAICALVAREKRAGRARRVPETPELDPRGLRMEIWF